MSKIITLTDYYYLKTEIDEFLAQKASTSHTHGNITTNGSILNQANKNVVTNANGTIVTEDKPTIPTANSTATNIKMDGTQNAGSLATFAKADHVHPTDTSRAAASHTHDDRYYTESEINTKLSGKSDTSHNHDGTYLKSYTPPTGSTSQAGIVKLNSATNSTSTTEAATPSAVKSAYDLANNKTVTLTKLSTATTGYIATYEVKQGTTSLGKIDIPKDYLVKSGSVKTVTTANSPVSGYAVGDKYIDFVINTKDSSGTDEHVYINVKDLIDTYEPATQSENGLMTAADKKKLDGIATGANAYSHPSGTAKTGNPTANQTPAFGSTFTITQFTSNSTGHISGATDRTVKIPNNLGNGTTAGLSTNDYTTTEKSKLAGIATGATKNTVSNSLSDTSTTNALSAAQGKALNEKFSKYATTDAVDNIVAGNVDLTGYVKTTDSRLTDARTPTAHTDSNGAYGKATTSVWGHTKLSSATNSTDETMSATPKAVKTAYDLANGKSTVSVKQTKTSGIEIGSVTVNGTETKLYQQDNNTTYTPASATPLVDSITGTVGTSVKYAREDHTHPNYDYTGLKGTDNTSGYVNLIKITIGATYQDKPIVVKTQHRDKIERSVIQIKFSNVNNNDPALQSITHTGQDMEFHLYKESTSNWILACGKGHNGKYDDVFVKIDNPNIGITTSKLGTHLATLPTSNITQSTYIGFTSAEKTKLSGIATGANKTTITNNLTTSTTGTALDASQGTWLYNNKANKSNGVSQITDTNANQYTNIGSLSSGATQQAINSKIDEKIGTLSNIKAIEVVASKPTASASTMNKLYIVSENNKVNVYYTKQSGSTYSWSKMDTDILDELSIAWNDITGKPTGSTSQAGIVQLNDAVNSSSTTQAATANAVNKTYTEFSNSSKTTKNGHTHSYLPSNADGTTTGNITATTSGKGIITANQFKKNGGTSGQFLKADGSVDSNTYLTTSSASSTYQPKGNYLTSHNPVDSALSSTSTNAVQNKVINTALSGKAPTSHASTGTGYGVGTSANYGHNKIIDDATKSTLTNGESLSAHMGYVLNNQDVEYVVSTHTSSTSTWTGTCSKLRKLEAGTKIYYRLNQDPTTTDVTLNLTLADNTTTGAKNVFFGGTRLKNQYPKYAVIGMVYDGSNWIVINQYTDTNTTYGADRGISNVSGKFGHSNTAITAQTTSALKKIKYDAYGHITGTDNVGASDLPSHTHSYIPSNADGTTTGNITATTSGKGIITANQFKKNDGTSNDILMADGSTKSLTSVIADAWENETFTNGSTSLSWRGLTLKFKINKILKMGKIYCSGKLTTAFASGITAAGYALAGCTPNLRVFTPLSDNIQYFLSVDTGGEIHFINNKSTATGTGDTLAGTLLFSFGEEWYGV